MAVVVSIAPTSEAALPAVVLMDTHSSQIKLHAKQMASYFHITEGMLLASEQFLCASSEVYIVYDSGCYARKLGQFAGSLTGLQNCVLQASLSLHFKKGMVSFHLFTFLYLLVQCLS